MGTTGTGNFDNYRSGNGPSKGPDTGGAGGGGGDSCLVDEASIQLEDVATCPYFASTAAVPVAGASVSVAPSLYNGRIAIVDGSQAVIGVLPTQYSFVFRCIQAGYQYAGAVVSSGLQPIPRVAISLKSQ